MRHYLLDTTIVSAYLGASAVAVHLVSPWIQQHKAATSILVYGEVTEYFKGKPNYVTHHSALRTFLRGAYPYFLSYAIMDRYADLRRQMRKPHGPGLIGDIDTLIAATALVHNLTVVTTDTDFKCVPHLLYQLINRDEMTHS